jgi:hypothetical protein
MIKVNIKTATFLAVGLLATGAFFYAAQSQAQLNSGSLSGVYGCTVKDDRWGINPEVGNRYDVSSLVFTMDMTNKKMSGIDMRYTFNQSNDPNGKITPAAHRFYKDETIYLSSTELMNVYEMNVDDDGKWFIVATNGGNTLLISGPPNKNWVSASGVCQKM